MYLKIHRKMKNCILVLLLGIFSATMVSGQTGTIRGYVHEDATGDPIMFGTVLVNETGGGNTTDLDGAYSLELPVGTYSLTYSYIGYADMTVNAVEVLEGEVTTLDVRIKEDSEMIEEVVITAKQLRNNEIVLATLKKKSTKFIDAIGASSIKRSGDGDAAAAVKSCLLYTSPSPRDS